MLSQLGQLLLIFEKYNFRKSEVNKRVAVHKEKLCSNNLHFKFGFFKKRIITILKNNYS
jgi:hypothetical protein